LPKAWGKTPSAPEGLESGIDTGPLAAERAQLYVFRECVVPIIDRERR